MGAPSALTAASFLLLVLVMLALATRVVLRAGGAPALGAMLLLYLVLPAALARAGLLERYSPLPAPALVLAFGLLVLTAIVALSPLGRRLAATTSLAALVGYQAFRVPVEWLLHRMYLEGFVPVQMTWAGRNSDLITGLTAAVLGLWLGAGRSVPRWVLLGWNVLGLALLVNIVTVAVLSTPVPFRRFTEGPPNLLPSTFPFVWLPSFLVQLAGFGHLALFRRLGRRGKVPDGA
ncbi:MAG TPA: hypothetical protein VNK43_00965 [Gemmatimonadales bacterium]|nr:hypothetical protein [Gemmatimonadales bacterium]